jgi:hypothetical protein
MYTDSGKSYGEVTGRNNGGNARENVGMWGGGQSWADYDGGQ